jgi:hypothetical protein
MANQTFLLINCFSIYGFLVIKLLDLLDLEFYQVSLQKSVEHVESYGCQ